MYKNRDKQTVNNSSKRTVHPPDNTGYTFPPKEDASLANQRILGNKYLHFIVLDKGRGPGWAGPYRTAKPSAETSSGTSKQQDVNLIDLRQVPSNINEVRQSPGQPLNAEIRSSLEPQWGHDFRNVKIHTDPLAAQSAQSIHALAYTVGKDVVFAAGQYNVQTGEGRQLLFHELSHVLQQEDRINNPRENKIALESSSASEVEAVQASNFMLMGQSIPHITPANTQIACQKAERPIGETLGVAKTLPFKGDPTQHPNYVQNVVKGVGIFGWGGPFRLDRKIVNGMGVDSLYVPRDEFDLVKDPLKGISIAINQIYVSRAAANTAVSALGRKGTYTFYVGPGGLYFPTIISDTTAPALCEALRKAVEVERTNARAAAKLGVDLALWYIGARYPLKPGTQTQGTSIPKTGSSTGAAAATAAGSGPKGALVYVEIGAGDLKASIQLAKKGGVKVIAVDPAAPSAAAMRELEAAGGTFVRGTAQKIASNTADHVFQYLPWRIGGSGSMASGGTWRLISDTLRILKPNGAAHFVTEDLATAQFLAKEASKRSLRVVITQTTAGAAAPGASGAGVPNFAKSKIVWLVNIYL